MASINIGSPLNMYVKNRTLVIVLIISLPICFDEIVKFLMLIFLSFSISSLIDDDIVIATSIIAPSEPINSSGIMISSGGTVKYDNSLKLMPSYFVNVTTISTNIKSIITDANTDTIAETVFLLIPPAMNNEKIENTIDSIIQRKSKLMPLKYKSNPI